MLVWHNFVARFDEKLRKFILPQPEYWEQYEGELAFAKGGGGSTQEVVPTGPWGPQIPFIQQLFDQASQLLSGAGPQYFTGSTVAPINPTLQGSQDAISQYITSQVPINQGWQGGMQNFAQGAGSTPLAGVAGGVAPGVQQGIGALLTGGPSGAGPLAQGQVPAAGQAFSTALAGQSPISGSQLGTALNETLTGTALNPWLDQVVQGASRSMLRNFNDNILPNIGHSAVAAGQSGGSREGIATGIAASRLNQDIGDITARLYGNAFDQGAAQRMQGLQLGSQLYDTAGNRQLQGAQTVGQLLTDTARTGVAAQGTGAEVGTNLLTQGNQQAMNQFLQGMLGVQQGQANQMGQFGAQNNLGLQQQTLQQNALNDLVNRWFFEQYAPYNALSQFQSFISGGYGSSVPGRR